MKLPKIPIQLEFKDKLMLLTLAFFLVALPLTTSIALRQTKYRSSAAPLPSTPPVPTITPLLTPTQGVKPTPTATPSLKPTPTPTITIITPTPTPSPTPISNRPPVVSTNYLPNGKLFSNYQAVIEGYDADTGDTLSMTVSGLPRGLRQSGCTTSGNQISCQITGRPYRSGSFQVRIVLSDSKGNNTEKILPLTVAGFSWGGWF